MPELKLFTIADLRSWLVDGQPVDGLSEQTIAPTRAWAILHNPYVREDDPVLAAIYEEGNLAAYTASFPDMLDGRRVWWCSTLYCFPQYAGKGYGLIVLGSLKEAHEPELTYDRWGAQETVEICTHLGLKTMYTPRYTLCDKKIRTDSFKGKLASYVQNVHKRIKRMNLHESDAQYTLRYATCIDGEAFQFIQAHRGNDLWLREQDMLNWILSYLFVQSCALQDRVVKDTEFTANRKDYRYSVVKVFADSQLIAVYVLRYSEGTISVVYLYYEHSQQDIVFASVLDHIIASRANAFVTENEDLVGYIHKRMYFPKHLEEKISLSLPEKLDNKFTLQLGDGDSFA